MSTIIVVKVAVDYYKDFGISYKVSFDAVIRVNLVKMVVGWKSNLTGWGIKSGCNGSVIVDIK
jgi:hypothetical protein